MKNEKILDGLVAVRHRSLQAPDHDNERCVMYIPNRAVEQVNSGAVEKQIIKIFKAAKRIILPSIQLTVAFLFLIPTFSFGSVADWFYSSDRDKTHQSYTQNNYAYRDEWANCNSPLQPSTLGLFSITPQKDFLYGAFTRDTARMWEMNGTLSHDLKTYVAPDINASDYGSVKLHLRQVEHSSWFHRIFSTYGASAVNSEIPKFTVWEQHSFVSGMYEPQKFSNVQMNGNAYKSFDVATARDNWIVRERASDITCDAANRPTSMMLRTYDIAGNVFAQKMDNIVYAQSADVSRRQTMLADAQSKIEKTEYYGHRQIYDGLIGTLDAAKYVPASFNLTTRDPRGNTTNIAFTNVQWKNDAVIGFDAVLDAVPTRNGIATTMHAMPVFSNEGQRIGVTVDVTDSAGTRAFTWKADDQTAFKDFAKQIMQGVNPLDIMGSSRVQMEEVKVAWLAQGYDKVGLLENHKSSLALVAGGHSVEEPQGLLKKAFDTTKEKTLQTVDLLKNPEDRCKMQIERQYHIKVLDGTNKWTAAELELVRDTLKELPSLYYGKTSLQTIQRDSVYIDRKKQSDPSTMGLYNSQTHCIYIYDSAKMPDNFKNPTTQFRATLIHELTHSIQCFDPKTKNVWLYPIDNPIMQRYSDITGWSNNKPQSPPSKYAAYGGVAEDMCESAMYYVFNPSYLKNTSPERYTFLSTTIFNKREYNYKEELR